MQNIYCGKITKLSRFNYLIITKLSQKIMRHRAKRKQMKYAGCSPDELKPEVRAALEVISRRNMKLILFRLHNFVGLSKTIFGANVVYRSSPYYWRDKSF